MEAGGWGTESGFCVSYELVKSEKRDPIPCVCRVKPEKNQDCCGLIAGHRLFLRGNGAPPVCS